MPQTASGWIVVGLLLLFGLCLALDLIVGNVIIAFVIILIEAITYDRADPRRGANISSIVIMSLYIVFVIVAWLGGWSGGW
ncbi:MAG: hypothetical protein MK116_08635 [Phycisphaerales bacterium]|nr:hypothetical protein [Phycisphaerales bacterium]